PATAKQGGICTTCEGSLGITGTVFVFDLIYFVVFICSQFKGAWILAKTWKVAGGGKFV
ncbi:MAG: hypothetical protein G01um101470_936, partial [Parcubacteria group bacterium Gr01-1014_70]